MRPAIVNGAISLPMLEYGFPGAGLCSNGVEDDQEIYESVKCLACGALHFVNTNNRKLLGSDDE
jgi:hypothetical protein